MPRKALPRRRYRCPKCSHEYTSTADVKIDVYCNKDHGLRSGMVAMVVIWEREPVEQEVDGDPEDGRTLEPPTRIIRIPRRK